MTTAGEAAFQHIKTYYPQARSILILCGSGNNGGDGYVVGSCAMQGGWEVTLIATSPPKTPDANTVAQQYQSLGGQIIETADMKRLNTKPDLIIDALLGVGLTGAPRGVYAELIKYANQQESPIVALDVPSGLDADTGQAFSPCIQAANTITFIAQKLGLVIGDGLKQAGRVDLETLGLTPEVYQQVAGVDESFYT
jgi:NAD(P)H-hydrate epimerase